MYSQKIRIYYDNTDAEGIVYHSRYLDICERVRTDYLREKNIIHSKLYEEQGICLVVKSLNIEYKRPAKVDDLVEVNVNIIENNGILIKLQQQIFLLERNNTKTEKQLLVNVNLEIVMINKKNKLIRIPKEIMEKLK